MKRDATVFVPGVVSLAASSRRTLKHGDTFAMFDEFGDVLEVERSPYGLFHYDTRFLSQLLFTIEGHRPLMLSSTVQTDNVTLDVDLTNPDIFVDGQLVLGKETFHVARAKFLWEASCYELFTITSYSASPARLRFALDFDADFADLFEIRGHTRARRGELRAEVRNPAEVAFLYDGLDGLRRASRMCFSVKPETLDTGRAEFLLELRARERRAIGVTIHCHHGDHPASATKSGVESTDP